MRPYWTGQIRLSLVSLAVEIFPAVNNYRTIPLHEIYRKTGERVRHQNVVNDQPVEREDIIKGYEYEKGEYVEIEPEEIKNLKLPSSDVLEIVQFVDSSEIDPLYFERPYFVVPKNDAAKKAFAIIRESLRKTKKFGLGQLVIGGRERLCVLKPCGRGMMIDIIRYKEEVRRADAYFDEIEEVKLKQDELDLAEQLIKQKSAKFNPAKFHDHYNEALQELIDSKLHKKKVKKTIEHKSNPKVINLMDALKKSLAEKNSPKKPTPKKRAGRK
ncbi:MAG: Ku protein [Pseudomonadota bacterium]